MHLKIEKLQLVNEELIPISLLFNNFLKKLTELGLISSLTGQILYDPIYIEGSTDAVERHFIEECLRKNGKNPFTRAPMSVDDLQKIPSSLRVHSQITEETQHLTKNKSEAQTKELKTLIVSETYNPASSRGIQLSSPVFDSSDSPSDDVLGMDMPSSPRGKWIKIGDWSSHHIDGQIVNRIKYIKDNPAHIYDLELHKYDDEYFGVMLTAGESIPISLAISFFGIKAPMRREEHNMQLRRTLESYDIQQHTPFVVKFPLPQNYVFKYKAPLEVVTTILPTLFNCIEELEGQNSTIWLRKEIMDLFLSLSANNSFFIY